MAFIFKCYTFEHCTVIALLFLILNNKINDKEKILAIHCATCKTDGRHFIKQATVKFPIMFLAGVNRKL